MKAKKSPRAPTATTAAVKTTGHRGDDRGNDGDDAPEDHEHQLDLAGLRLGGLVGRKDHALDGLFGAELPDVLLLCRRERIVDVSGDQDTHRLGSLVPRRP
jgi:hypothetical protein